MSTIALSREELVAAERFRNEIVKLGTRIRIRQETATAGLALAVADSIVTLEDHYGDDVEELITRFVLNLRSIIDYHKAATKH
jgi:hypothetical protein